MVFIHIFDGWEVDELTSLFSVLIVLEVYCRYLIGVFEVICVLLVVVVGVVSLWFNDCWVLRNLCWVLILYEW